MPTALTERQNEALEFVRRYHREHRKPPTLREIGVALGIRSPNGVSKLLRALEAKGYLGRDPHVARGLVLRDEDAHALGDGVPTVMIVSRTSSAQPERLRSRPNGVLALDPSWFDGADPDACILARAGDDGMNPDGIRKGDLLLIEEVDAGVLDNGTLTAFLVGEELKVRRFHHANGRHHLRPADRRYTEEVFAPGDARCHVVGRVLALMRKV